MTRTRRAKYLLTALALLLIAGCASVLSGDNAITSFAFLVANNPGLTEGYTGIITGTGVTVTMPFYEDRSGLIATFTTTGALVEVGGVEQQSGVTANDFVRVLEYLVTASDGTTQTYTVDATTGMKISAKGGSVSISGDYAIVGVAYEDGDAGAAYLFRRVGTNSWDTGVKLAAADSEGYDHFGQAVSISGDYAIAGAWGEDTGGSNAGAAYVFHRTGASSWDTGVKLVAPDAQAGDAFGFAVSISGDYAIAGAYDESTGGNGAGAAYVFHRAGTNTWDTGVKLVAPDAEAGDLFGWSLSIAGDDVVVGAMQEDGASSAAGAAYVFHRAGTNTWDTGVKLVAPDAQAGDIFGRSVAISGDYAIVGAYQEDTGGSDAGAAYVFHRTGTNTWDTGTKIVAPDAQPGDYFGSGISVSGDGAIVGAPGEEGGGTDAGAAYMFRRTGTNAWEYIAKFSGPDTGDGDAFGAFVSISGDDLIVSAPLHDGAGTDSGAAYVFR